MGGGPPAPRSATENQRAIQDRSSVYFFTSMGWGWFLATQNPVFMYTEKIRSTLTEPHSVVIPPAAFS
jgi:hypothetical protein